MLRAGVLAALAMVACGEHRPPSRGTDVALVMPTSSAIAAQGSTKLAAASHACAITDGRAACWGYDHFRQLGRVAGESCKGLGCELAPCTLDTPDTFTSVAAGENTTCAIGGKDGGVWCWGEANVGQLGAEPGARCGDHLNSWPCSETPTKIDGLRDARSIAIGNHVCAALAGGDVWCWGANDSGQLGAASTDRCVPNLAEMTGLHGERTTTPSMACSRTPLRVAGLGGVVQLAAGRQHTCALTAGGHVLCWGDNAQGQLGIGNALRADAPTRIPGLDGIIGISAAMSTTCAWRSDGDALCWGSNDSGQLGVPTTETCGGSPCARKPQEVTGNVAEVGVGFTHVCARRRDGTVGCWGLDVEDQLGFVGDDVCGHGRQPCSTVPHRVTGIAKASALAVGHGFACALVADQGGTLPASPVGGAEAPGIARIECWGRNVLGSLGDGVTKSRKRPAPIGAARRCR